MARLYPILSEVELNDLQSRAEAKFYRACAFQLDDDCLVLHGREWIMRDGDRSAYEGETDFTIVNRAGGILIVEVKGGGIRRDARTGNWSSINKAGKRFEIKDPFAQARIQKHATVSILESDTRWVTGDFKNVVIGYGVFFPDVETVDALVSPESPAAIIGCAKQLSTIAAWIRGAISLWSGRIPKKPLGHLGLSIVQDLFCKEIEIRPVMATSLRDEEHHRIILTGQQARTLQLLGARNRVRIAGGAGTGKTLLALEKARRLAEQGKETLFLCYNRPLANFLSSSVASIDHLKVMTFHQMCEWAIGAVRARTNRDLLAEVALKNPNADEFDVLRPEALATASELLMDRYDAIIVDEGQDFKSNYWFAIELFLRDPRTGAFFVFYDENQAIYTNLTDCGITEPPFVLSVNCRNTRFIHDAAYQFYRGEIVSEPEIVGEPVTTVIARTLHEQASKLTAAVRKLVREERVRTDQIQVLVAGVPKASYYEALRQECADFTFEFENNNRRPTVVNVDTVSRFKGLEADVVMLWGAQELAKSPDRSEALYVGLSRAKGRLFLIGTADVKSIISHLSGGKAE